MQIMKNNSGKKSLLLDQIISMDEERLSLLSVADNCSFSIRQYINWVSEREIRLIRRFRKKFGIYPPGVPSIYVETAHVFVSEDSIFNSSG